MSILETYERASPKDIALGTNWYPAAHAYAQGLAIRYHISTAQAAAIIAVLSPQLHWTKNQLAAHQLISTGDTNLALGQNRDKARLILRKGVLATYPPTGRSAISGPKVQSFYSNILLPLTSRSVTIDRHALAIYDPDLTQYDLNRADTYDKIADAYRLTARQLNIRPLTLQAITWTTHRRLKRQPQKESLF